MTPHELEADIELLTTELLARQDELVALYNLAQSTRNLVDVEGLMAVVVTELRGLFRVEHGFMLLCDGDGMRERQSPAGRLSGQTLFRWLDLVRDRQRDLMIANSDVPQVRDALVAPLVIDGQVVAAVGLSNRLEGAFSAPDRKRLLMIAEQVGAHLENLLLQEERIAQVRIQSEMELARDVQWHLLPKQVPSLAGLDVSARSLSAFDVGGDFYDFVTQNTTLTFALGDVAGKGMSAAMLMAMVRTTLRTAAHFMQNVVPSDLIKEANTLLYNDFTEVSRFATLFTGRYEAKTRCLQFANAGHSPVIFCPANGQAQMLEADGVPLGVLDDCLVEPRTLRLNSGDVLIVATDGFPEAEDDVGGMLGYEKLFEVATWGASDAAISADAIRHSLFDAVTNFSNGVMQNDDMTVIVLKGTA
jgi:sigma-B regulation protein RsbU (phosphoserine phosphatase)